MADPDDLMLRRYTALVGASVDFIAILGAESGRVDYMNSAGRQMLGVAEDADLSGYALNDFFAAADVEALMAAGDAMWTGESELQGSDGPIPVVLTTFELREEQTGEALGRVLIQTDMRGRRVVNAEVATARQKLADSQERQRALLLHMADVLVVLDAEGVLRYASPSAGRLLGYPEGSALGHDVRELIHPDDRDRISGVLQEVSRRPGPGREVRLRLLTAEGRAVPFEAVPSNLLDDPALEGIVIVARNIEERVREERQASGHARVLELIAGGATVAVVLEALCHWFESSMGDIRCTVLLSEQTRHGPVLRDVASPSMPAAYHEAIDGISVAAEFSPCAVAVRTQTPVLVEDFHTDVRWAPMAALAATLDVRTCWSFPIASPASGRVLGSFALYRAQAGLPDDATKALVARASHLVGITVDQHELMSRLDHQARHDALTGLPNRLLLLEKLDAALHSYSEEGGPRPVVVFLDLDRLKVVNDSLGHEIGDELLVDMARRLRGAVSPFDLVARFGGDEFVVLCPDAEADVEALVTKILEVVAEPIVLEGRRITPGASAGVVIPSPGETATEVLRDADIAMYRAKHRGGGGYTLFGPQMRQRAFDRLDIEEQIRHGISHDEFRVFYQPVVDMRAGNRFVGFEALVRWQHPTRGLLTPEDFLALAEETGLIVPLGDWVLRTAVSTARHWSTVASTSGMTMSVNLAAQQLHVDELQNTIKSASEAISPWVLDLEFTESALMDETRAASAAIAQLAASGARLSIDDFGTGFSSLSYLTRLPVHRLKIDRSFIADLAHKPEATTVVAAVISLAKNLGLGVVAEGVETEEQRDVLLERGCGLAQGYLFARPLPASEALPLLLAKQR
ncbi:MAG: putative signaling protein [Frankiales bacterium]|nr:putative signaling protein [Frankiales bacterium]